jgi:hypothetical protein
MIYELHPDIRKFWEDQGCTLHQHIFFEPSLDSDAKIWWMIEKDHTLTALIAITLRNGTNLYYFDGNKYTEEEALRIIKLKAFF